MSDAPLPTTDLYFLNSCGGWVRSWRRKGTVTRMGANSFRSSDRFLLIRRDTPDLMEQALAWPGRLIYLIDDDIDGAASSPGLPLAYKARLADFARIYYDRLLRRADMIVVSSDVLATKLRSDPRVDADIVRLDPFWALPFADQRHFPRSVGSRLDIVHLGTASHAGALARMTPAVIAMLDRHADTRFTFLGAAGDHPDLEAHPRVRRVNIMGWRRYGRWLPRQRFHLALYPLDQTPFDQARSANKMFEHAIVGAVGVYSRDWRFADMIADGALLAPADPAEWTLILTEAAEQRAGLARTARAAAAMLAARHSREAQQHAWKTLLNIQNDERVGG